MKKHITLFLIMCVTVFYAQNSVSGKVTDIHNNPLEGVEVIIQKLQKGTITNQDGYFELTNIATNNIEINFFYLGYQTVNKTLEITSNTVLNINMEEAVFKMNEIIISTPFNKLQADNVMKVEKATLAQLTSKGSIGLADGISNISGVSQVTTGTGIGKPVIRGLRGNRVLVYHQGVRLENQQFGDEHGLGIDDSSIESVEVIKGPASLLYGSDALGGVLYFNPLKFANTNQFKLNVSQKIFSNTLGSNTSVTLKKSFENFKVLAQGSYNTHSDYKIPNKNRVTNTRFNETIFNAGIGFNTKNTINTLRYNYNLSKIGIPEEIELQSESKDIKVPYQNLANNMVSFNNTILFENSKLTTVLGYTLNERKEFEENHDHGEDEHTEAEHEEDLEAAINLKLTTFSYDSKYNFTPFLSIETVLGIQGIFQKNENFGEEILIPNAETKDFGVFLTGMKTFKNQSSLQAGIRFDNRNIDTEFHEVSHEDEVHTYPAITKNFNNISASVGYKTNLFNKITTRLNVASGFKAPTLAELTSNGVHHGTNRYEIGNENLNSERNLQLDLALEYSGKHWEIFTNTFYNHINNYIFVSPTNNFEDGYQIFNYLQEDAKLYGGEFGIHLHPHPLDWLHINNTFEMVIGKQNNGNYLPLIPAHKITTTLRGEFTINNWLNNGFAFVMFKNYLKQNNTGIFETATPGYNLVNIGTGGLVRIDKFKMSINFNINNLFNKSYINHLSRLKNEGIYNMGRNYVLGLNFTF